MWDPRDGRDPRHQWEGTLITRLELLTQAANNVGRQLSTLAADGVTTFKDRLTQVLNDVVQPWVAAGVTEVSPAGHYFTELCRAADMHTVLNDKAYTLPAEFRELFSLVILDGTNSWKLRAISRRLAERLFPDPATYPATERPRWYVRYGKTIELIPVPNGVYVIRMRYGVWPLAMTHDNASSELLRKDDVIVARLTGEAYSMTQEYESDAKEWFAKSEALLARAVVADAKDHDWEPMPISEGPLGSGPLGEYWADPFVQGVG